MTGNQHHLRALVIGLDGATFELLQPVVPEPAREVVEQTWLPNLRRALSASAHGLLRSTIPPLTAPAWSSFLTGLSPARHGVFSFQKRAANKGAERVFVNSTALKAPRLWHWLASHGLTTGAINVPMTWPPQPMPEGSYLVTGMLTPNMDSPFTEPPQLASQLRLLGYVCDLRIKLNERDVTSSSGMTAVAQDLRQVLLRREQAIFQLLEQWPTDVLVAVFETPDRLQHWAWRAIEDLLTNDGSLVRTALHEAVEACYFELDRVIGRLLEEAAGPDTYVFFLSDHGFGPLRTRFHVNQWLAQQGWLCYEGHKATLRQYLRRPLRRIKRLLPRSLLLRGRQTLAVSRIIDWSRTLAYSGRAMEHAIYINLRGREPQGIVEPEQFDALRQQIAKALRVIRDPRTGTPVVRDVYLREELYDGPYVDEAPDLIFTLMPGYEPTAELPPRFFRLDKVPRLMEDDSPRAREPSVSGQGVLSDALDEGAGIHQPEGVFMALGPGVRAGATLPEQRIEDVLPTLMYALGLPVPAWLDGQVITAAFEPAYLAAHPVSHSDQPPPTVPASEADFSAQEADQVRERLEALGYLS